MSDHEEDKGTEPTGFDLKPNQGITFTLRSEQHAEYQSSSELEGSPFWRNQGLVIDEFRKRRFRGALVAIGSVILTWPFEVTGTEYLAALSKPLVLGKLFPGQAADPLTERLELRGGVAEVHQVILRPAFLLCPLNALWARSVKLARAQVFTSTPDGFANRHLFEALLSCVPAGSSLE